MNSLEQIMPLTWWGILIVGLLSLIPYVFIILLNQQLRRFKNAYLALQTFVSGNSLDQLLHQYLEEVKKIRESLEKSDQRLEKVEQKLRASVDRAELIRFNAFENMGSDLSFALALLNQEGNGVVLSSINNRDESRVYAKPIVAGTSTYHLSEEEKQVIAKAKDTVRV